MSNFGFLPKSRVHADDEGWLVMKNIVDDIKMMVNVDVKICLFFNFLYQLSYYINVQIKGGEKRFLLVVLCV